MDNYGWIRTTPFPQAIALWWHHESVTRGLAVNRSPGPAVHRQGEVRTGLPQRVAAHSPRQSEERESQGEAHVLPGVHYLLPLPCSGYHGCGADVLLSAAAAAGIPGYEGPPVCGLSWKLLAQHAPLGGPRHGDLRLPAHVPGLLHRVLQTAATVQLGDWGGAVPAHIGTLVHGLSSALGPARLLGHHGRHKHWQLRSVGGRARTRAAAGRPHGGRVGVTALLRAARGGAAGAHDAADHGALLAGPQGWRALAAGMEVEGGEIRATGHHRGVRHQCSTGGGSGFEGQDLWPHGGGNRQTHLRDREHGRGGRYRLFLSVCLFPRGHRFAGNGYYRDGGFAFLESTAGGVSQSGEDA